MKNVHTLSTVGGGGGNVRGGDSLPMTRHDSGLYAETPEPRFIDIFFPGFTLKSFIFWISMIQIAIFIAECIFGSNGLVPTGKTLYTFGESYGPPIQAGQVWRLFNPIFLHATIWHLAFNVFFQLRMGFMLEQQLGMQKVGMLYFASGIGGNLLSVAWAPCKTAVGASTAGFGLIGIQIATAWHTLQRKDQMIYNIVLFVVISVMVSAGPRSVVDWRGHLGGFIVGSTLGVLFCQGAFTLPEWYGKARIGSIVLLVALFAICPAVIYGIPMGTRCGV